MPSNGNINKARPIKKWLIIVAIVLAVLAAFMLWPTNISRQEAMEIALSHVGGGVASRPERDFEAFQRAWNVEVFYGGIVYEIYINANTGAIISVEIDRW